MIGAEPASFGSATRCATVMRVSRGVATSSTIMTMCTPTGHSGIIAFVVGRSFESTNVNVNDRRVGARTSSNTPRIETSCRSGQRCWNRITPPGRASISQNGTSTLSGANQRAKCSALVHASKTSSGGAGYSRSSIRSALAATRMAPSGGLLQLFQIGTQPIEARVPELAVPVGPRRDLLERRGIELARARLRFSTAPDQARTLEDAQVLAYCRTAHVERSRQLLHIRGARRQPLQDRAAGRIGERSERLAQCVGLHLTRWLSN